MVVKDHLKGLTSFHLNNPHGSVSAMKDEKLQVKDRESKLLETEKIWRLLADKIERNNAK